MSDETVRALQQRLIAYRQDERHATVAETRFWLGQYKLLAEDAINALLRAAPPLPEGMVAVPLPMAEHLAGTTLEVGHKCPICKAFRELLAAAKEPK